jgi:hypothetical protein
VIVISVGVLARTEGRTYRNSIVMSDCDDEELIFCTQREVNYQRQKESEVGAERYVYHGE